MFLLVGIVATTTGKDNRRALLDNEMGDDAEGRKRREGGGNRGRK